MTITVKQQVAAVANDLAESQATLAAIVANWTDVVDPPLPTGDEPDPRSTRAKKFNADGGKVNGMRLVVKKQPETEYCLVDFDVIPEEDSKGSTHAIVHVWKWAKFWGRNILVPARENVVLAWPCGADGNLDAMEGSGIPGNVSEPYDHITESVFPINKVGPLAIYVAGADGSFNSDIGGGMGLPGGRHVSFHLVFVKRPSA